MTLEFLNEQKQKYQQRAEYFKKMEFDILAADFQSVVVLISEMEKFLNKEELNKT